MNVSPSLRYEETAAIAEAYVNWHNRQDPTARMRWLQIDQIHQNGLQPFSTKQYQSKMIVTGWNGAFLEARSSTEMRVAIEIDPRWGPRLRHRWDRP